MSSATSEQEVVGPFARLEPALELPIARSFMVPCLMFGSTEKLSRRSPRLLSHAEFQLLLTTGYGGGAHVPRTSAFAASPKALDERALRDMMEQAYR